jgi:hypothetical protein
MDNKACALQTFVEMIRGRFAEVSRDTKARAGRSSEAAGRGRGMALAKRVTHKKPISE